jgi:hypothetical protein
MYLTTQNPRYRQRGLKAQFKICLGLVESRGLVKRLSFGNMVLLQPEFLDSYASAIINAAKEEPEGEGCIAEEIAVSGNFRMPKKERIKDKDAEKILLISTIQDLLRHEIAFREFLDDGPQLVFPSQFTREWSEAPDPEGKTVRFCFSGPILNIYATLTVRLSNSGTFKKKDMWRNAASFESITGGVCGIYLRETGDGYGELTLFFNNEARQESRILFENYVYTHLVRRSLPSSVVRQ